MVVRLKSNTAAIDRDNECPWIYLTHLHSMDLILIQWGQSLLGVQGAKEKLRIQSVDMSRCL
jgi:hypothetical protein